VPTTETLTKLYVELSVRLHLVTATKLTAIHCLTNEPLCTSSKRFHFASSSFLEPFAFIPSLAFSDSFQPRLPSLLASA
jgi:hypothetical protein